MQTEEKTLEYQGKTSDFCWQRKKQTGDNTSESQARDLQRLIYEKSLKEKNVTRHYGDRHLLYLKVLGSRE